MKTINFKKVAAMIAISALFGMSFTSCGGDDPKPDPTPDPTDSVLAENITADLTLTKDQTWYVNGEVHVKAGATLTIEAGTQIVAKSDIVSYILIEQGAKIMAEGTVAEPIVFTADTKEAGAWGSLHICGKAPINKSGGTGSSEIGDATYGGSDAADNSGVISYCRFEYTGVALDEEHESNGLSLYGVGSGTTIDHIQIIDGNDDGIEFFGGTVNVKYAYVVGAGDDCFDWTQGWSGKGQYWLAKQTTAKGDRGIEGDNSSSDNMATPYANPTLSQVTLIGGYANGDDAGVYGMKLREGTKGQIYNVVVTGFDKRTIHVEHDQTLKNVNDGSLIVDYAVLNDDVSDKVVKYSQSEGSTETIEIDAAKDFAASANVTIETVAKSTSATFTGGKDMSSDSFFSADSNIGSGDAWTAGWTK